MNDLREASIGIFDSGFGGLTVMRAIKELLPHENILYFGDTARLPYGAKSGETILRYSLESAELLASRNIKLLVIACNTASCIALEAIRSHLGIPVIGVTEQGIEEVLRLLPEGRVGLWVPKPPFLLVSIKNSFSPVAPRYSYSPSLVLYSFLWLKRVISITRSAN